MSDQPIKILLIEDNPGDMVLVREMLSAGAHSDFHLEHADRLSAGIERLATEDFDAILLDLSLPDSEGMDTYAQVQDQAPKMPIVVLSGSGSEAMAIEAVQEGAQDYLVKGEVEASLLARAIRYAIERKRSQRVLQREKDLVAQLTNTSPVAITLVNHEGEIVFANAYAEQVLGLSRDELLQRTYNAPAWRITDYEGNPLPEQELPFRQVMEKREPVYGMRHAIEWPDGQRVLLSINGAPLLDEEGRVEQVVFALEDITERQETEQALAWEAEINTAIAELAGLLLSSASIEELSSLVLEQAKHLTDSEFGYVGHIDPETGFLVSSTMTRDVWEECQVEGKDFVFEEFSGLWGWVLENRESLMTNNPQCDPRSSGIPSGHISIDRFLSAPAMIEGNLVGQIALANATRDYTERDLELIERLAALFALAVQRKRREEQRVAQLKRELRTLERMTTPPTSVSAQSFGMAPFRKSLPEAFDEAVNAYEQLLDAALEQRAYRVEEESSQDVRALAERLGTLRAGPRDVVDIHTTALKNKSAQSNPLKVEFYAEEGRLIALELMGYLVSYYRNRCVGVWTRPTTDETGA